MKIMCVKSGSDILEIYSNIWRIDEGILKLYIDEECKGYFVNWDYWYTKEVKDET